MKVCVACGSDRCDDRWHCEACGFAPALTDGFLSFLLADRITDIAYRADLVRELAELEPSSFWFRARADLVSWAALSYFPRIERLLDVGCGAGYILERLRNDLPAAHLVGGDALLEGLEIAARRVPSASFYRMDATKIPFRRAFDIVTALDVLEHVDDDIAAIDEIASAVRPGGGMIVTAPQHRSLWSAQDVGAGHVRRYRAGQLRRRLESRGLEIVRATSFVSLLLPLLAVSRWTGEARRRGSEIDVLATLRPRRLERPLSATMRLERGLIRLGASFPFGGSVMVVARPRRHPLGAPG